MPYCVVWGCKSNSSTDKTVSWFSFPKDQPRFKAWVHYSKRQDFTPSKYSKICGKHFTKSQYSRDPARLAELGYPGARAALKDDAIPDIPVVVNDDSPAPRKPRIAVQKRRKNEEKMESPNQFSDIMKCDPNSDQKSVNLFTEMEQIQNTTTENTVLMSDFKWCDSATSLMLKLYREKQVKFNNPHVKKKVVWREIAEIMQQNGFAFDADRCERKFLNLKTSYRNTIQHNCMTGNLSRTCAFFAELHEIFQLQIGLEDSKSSPILQPSPVRLVANSNNVQVISVSEGKESRPTITSPPADQSTFRYSSQRQQTVQMSPQSQSSSESPFEKRPTPHSIPNSSPSSFHATASMFLEASAQRNSSSNRHTHGEFQAQQQKPPDNHNDRRQSTHQPVSNTTQRASSANSIAPSASTQVLQYQENGRHYQNTSVIDLCNNGRKRVQSTDDDARQERVKKRKNNDLQSLLTSFEKYREEQKGREDDRMKMMKEFHNEEMKVMNRFLDIIQHCIQYSSDD